jgi:hypothetical protein
LPRARRGKEIVKGKALAKAIVAFLPPPIKGVDRATGVASGSKKEVG